MLAPSELVALLIFLIILGGSGHIVGAFDPLLEGVGRGAELLKSYINADREGAPISVNNRNVESSDTKIEVHNHFYGTESPERPTISNDRPNQDNSNDNE